MIHADKGVRNSTGFFPLTCWFFYRTQPQIEMSDVFGFIELESSSFGRSRPVSSFPLTAWTFLKAIYERKSERRKEIRKGCSSEVPAKSKVDSSLRMRARCHATSWELCFVMLFSPEISKRVCLKTKNLLKRAQTRSGLKTQAIETRPGRFFFSRSFHLLWEKFCKRWAGEISFSNENLEAFSWLVYWEPDAEWNILE